jgi:hypothetical protein
MQDDFTHFIDNDTPQGQTISSSSNSKIFYSSSSRSTQASCNTDESTRCPYRDYSVLTVLQRVFSKQIQQLFCCLSWVQFRNQIQAVRMSSIAFHARSVKTFALENKISFPDGVRQDHVISSVRNGWRTLLWPGVQSISIFRNHLKLLEAMPSLFGASDPSFWMRLTQAPKVHSEVY